jgi:PncC family amidohydrolase
MTTQSDLNKSAKRLARLIAKHNLKIVFAESCTGGLISAVLTRIPGISAYHCGSAVVYQIETKAAWLGISEKMLKNPGPVSVEVARAMAEGVLAKTPHADVAASVTGFLGPESPPGKDGLVFTAVAIRKESPRSKAFETAVQKHQLETAAKNITATEAKRLRLQRQFIAANSVFEQIIEHLERRG